MPAALQDSSQMICEVWASNVGEEMRKIRQIIQSYNYVAMDTEFPGVVVRPIGEFRSTVDYQYQLLRCNVDLLKIIQLGLTFMNEDGDYPPGTTTWQFNFKFNLTEDMYSQDSIDLLQNSGLQFKKHEEEGIDTLYFAELLMTSGLVLCENVKWLSFHSGYDFGYLVKLLTDARLPEEEHEFFQILNLFFPAIYDVKYLMKSCKSLKVRPAGHRVYCFLHPRGTWSRLTPSPLVPAGGVAGSGRSAGAEEDWPAASGGVGFAAHGHGFLQDEGGTVFIVFRLTAVLLQLEVFVNLLRWFIKCLSRNAFINA
uniref:poly(A)-specific ribonuclease n=1 Tax=Oryzias latipes TaxID=8090 RepID=A0A3B3HC07_ORYLA